MRILLADADAHGRAALAARLRRGGHEVIEAGDGVEALAAAAARSPDLVVAEILLPGVDGYALCRELGRRGGPPLVFSTRSTVTPDDVRFAAALGAAGFAEYSPDPDRLAARLEELLVRGVHAPRAAPGMPEIEYLREHNRRLGAMLTARLVELERVNAELAAREAYVRAIIDTEPECLTLVAPDGSVRDVNAAGLRMFEADAPEEMRGRDIYDFIEPRDRDAFRRFVRRILRGRSETLEFRGVGLKGTRRVLETRATPLRDPGGRVTALLGIVRDITERRQAEEKIKRLNRVYAMLSGINAVIVRVQHREELFHEACRLAVDTGGFAMAAIGLLDRTHGRVRPVAVCGASRDLLAAVSSRLVLTDARGRRTPAGEAVAQKRAFVANDVARDERLALRDVLSAHGAGSFALLPLAIGGEPIALLWLVAREPGFFDDTELRLLTELGGDIAFALDHIDKEERLHYLAYYDALTGLANRTFFQERLTQLLRGADRDDTRLALCTLDLEHFRVVNDALGRHVGDALLIEVARRLQRAAANDAHVARLEADRFVLALPGLRREDEVMRRLQEVLGPCTREPYRIEDQELRVALRLGLAVYPNDAQDTERLMRNSETALKKAKARRERFLFYTAQMTDRVAEKLAFENRLRRALDRDEFVLYYQPKVEAASRRVVGLEALLRWADPANGLVTPKKFVPLLEQTGLIVDVGAWTMRRAVADHRAWRAAGLNAPVVAINVSPVQLRQPGFVETVRGALDGGGTPIALEITESVLLEDGEENIARLETLRALGVDIAIDDFGTGYSSLGYLARLPAQMLKVDLSFVARMLSDPDAMTLVSTIISLAHAMRLRVTAEGVEVERQARVLQELRCDELQGYLFGRPLPRDEVVRLFGARLAARGPGARPPPQ
ncbi:MAG TPA: EAL domain-containing protein [Burkholderiales bacterium]